MAYAEVQRKISPAGAGPQTTVFDSTPVEGNLMLASVQNQSTGSASVCADANGNWTVLNSLVNGARKVWLFGKIATASQPTSVTVTRSTDTHLMDLFEFSGNWDTIGTILDGAASGGTGTGVNTTVGTPSVTTSVANALVFTQIGLNNTVTGLSLSDGAFTLGFQIPVGALVYGDYWKNIASPSTVSPSFSWTTSRNWTHLTTAFLPAAVAGGNTAGLLPVF